MIHGVTHYGSQLIFHLQYHRRAIIEIFKSERPQKFFDLNKSVLYRKLLSNQTMYVKKQVYSVYYLEVKH